MSRKSLHSAVCTTLREVVNFINENEIEKEDILSMMKEKDYYILLYFK
jgi:hypothetical protein